MDSWFSNGFLNSGTSRTQGWWTLLGSVWWPPAGTHGTHRGLRAHLCPCSLDPEPGSPVFCLRILGFQLFSQLLPYYYCSIFWNRRFCSGFQGASLLTISGLPNDSWAISNSENLRTMFWTVAHQDPPPLYRQAFFSWDFKSRTQQY